jgi:hypothetical protein
MLADASRKANRATFLESDRIGFSTYGGTGVCEIY